MNILGLQIFPDVDHVTDELILTSADEWGIEQVVTLVESAGGAEVRVWPCTAHALVDGPTNYLLAAQHVAEEPTAVVEALTELLDGSTSPYDGGAVLLESMAVRVGTNSVTVYRDAPFTVTEQARAAAFALVTELVAARDVWAEPVDEPAPVVPLPGGATPVFRLGTVGDAVALVRMAQRCSAPTLAARFGAPLSGLQPRMARRLLSEGPALVVQVGDELVGLATLTLTEPAEVALLVEDGWQGRAVGARLLGLSARLAKAHGSGQLVLRSTSGSGLVPRLSAASGLNGRMRQADGQVELTISLRRVTPLPTDVDGAVVRRLDPAPA